jgi:hypothetical protein
VVEKYKLSQKQVNDHFDCKIKTKNLWRQSFVIAYGGRFK